MAREMPGDGDLYGPAIPKPVRTARMLMCFQVAITSLAIGSLLPFAGESPGLGVLLLAVGVSAAVVGVLAILLASRHNWARIVTIIVEELVFVNGVLGLISSPGLVRALGAAVVFTVIICLGKTPAWFTTRLA